MKRTELKRSAPLTRRDTGKAEAKVKLPKCAAPGCRARFVKLRDKQEVCGEACAQALVEARNAKAARIAEKQRKAAEKLARETDAAKREAMKTLPELTKEAQIAFNAFIRERDRQAGHPCISSGRPLRWGEFGGAVDAGHYRSTGSAPHLRFNEDNCHAQTAQDNRHGAGRAIEYRRGLIARIGLARVEVLESDNRVHKWTRDELRGIRDSYRAKLKALKSVASPSPNSGAQLGAYIA